MADLSKTQQNTLVQSNIVNLFNTSSYGGGFPNGPGALGSVNDSMLDPYDSQPVEATVSNYLTNDVSKNEYITAIKNLVTLYAKITRGMYGVTGNHTGVWTAYEIFFVKPVNHQAHYDTNINSVSSDTANELTGDVTEAVIVAYLQRMFAIINNTKDSVTVDLRVCHSSCHSNCHSARGRR